MGIESDQLVYDYLSRVGDVAQQRQLPSGTRMRLVSSLRNEIDKQRGKFGSDSPATVRRILGRLGDPEVLVRSVSGYPGDTDDTWSEPEPEPPAPAVPEQRTARRVVEPGEAKDGTKGATKGEPADTAGAGAGSGAGAEAPAPPWGQGMPKMGKLGTGGGISGLLGFSGLGGPSQARPDTEPDWWRLGSEGADGADGAKGADTKQGRRSGGRPGGGFSGGPGGGFAGEVDVPGFVGGLEIPDLIERPPWAVSGTPDTAEMVADADMRAGVAGPPAVEKAGRGRGLLGVLRLRRRRGGGGDGASVDGGSAKGRGLGLSSPFLLVAAALLVAGAFLGSWLALGGGWLLAYASRTLSRTEAKLAVFWLPGVSVAGGLVWLWGRMNGRWGELIPKDGMGPALQDTWPVVVRTAAVASALFLVWRSQRRRG
jgi:hypothetical protein